MRVATTTEHIIDAEDESYYVQLDSDNNVTIKRRADGSMVAMPLAVFNKIADLVTPNKIVINDYPQTPAVWPYTPNIAPLTVGYPKEWPNHTVWCGDVSGVTHTNTVEK